MQEQGMWVEALRICREYLPGHLNALQAEYQKEVGSKVARDINSLMVQARQWEQNGEFQTAVDCYVKVEYKITFFIVVNCYYNFLYMKMLINKI